MHAWAYLDDVLMHESSRELGLKAHIGGRNVRQNYLLDELSVFLLRHGTLQLLYCDVDDIGVAAPKYAHEDLAKCPTLSVLLVLGT